MTLIKKSARWLSQIYSNTVVARIHQNRRSSRLALFHLDDRQHLPVMTIDCEEHPTDEGPQACQNLVMTYGGFYRQLYRGSQIAEVNGPYHLTIHGIDIKRFAGFAGYSRELGKRSSFFLRHAKQALKKGYQAAFFNERNHALDMVAIHQSLKIRSFGVMFDALLVNTRRFGGVPVSSQLLPRPVCSRHWELLLGVFIPKPGYRQGALVVDKQLVGYARLHRIGNMLAYRDFMGHGQFLGDGVMKLLHVHIMQWVLDSAKDGHDPLVAGIENIAHGTIERGSDGLFFWKKKGLFEPYRVEMVEEDLPKDFSAEDYLALNPDVGLSNLSPAQHYQVHGRYEKRVYLRP
jgi:hypothetical protein